MYITSIRFSQRRDFASSKNRSRPHARCFSAKIFRPFRTISFSILLPISCIAALGQAPVPAGSEFRVNTTTADEQGIFSPYAHNPIAMNASGNFVVVWASNLQDGSGNGIYCQRYNAAGVAQGSEFQVNTFTTGAQFRPAVAMDLTGNFVVVWASQEQDSSGYGIYGQRFNASGTPQGTEFQINTFTAGDQINPSVAMDSAGNFVVTWESADLDGDGFGIFFKRFNAAGVPQGAEFQVNTYTTSDQEFASVSMDASGNFVVAWTSYGEDGSGNGIFARRFNAAGAALSGEFRVNTTIDNDQMFPSVAVNAGGNFVIAWESFDRDGSLFGVYAQRYNSSGTPQGGEFRVNTTTDNNQSFPVTAIDPNGGFTIAWQSQDQDGSALGIYAQRYDSTGNAQGGEFRVNTETNDDQYNPSLASDQNGNFVAVWISSGQDGSSLGVYGQRFVIPGSASPGDVIISEFRLSGPGGSQDEFIELYNTKASAIAVLGANGSAGWTLRSSDGSLALTIPNGEVIPANGHYLIANSSGYSLASSPGKEPIIAGSAPDRTYSGDVPLNVGIALFNSALPGNFDVAHRLDAVGPSSEANSLYKEGTGYLLPGSLGPAQYSFLRSLTSGVAKDTDNNSVDFLLVGTDGASYGVGALLGAPGPENSSGPPPRNGMLTPGLIDPAANAASSPNRVRTLRPDCPTCNNNTSNLGLLTVRRTYTNNTLSNVTRLRFRIIDMTTGPAPAGTADLRAIGGTGNVPVTITGGSTVTVLNTTLENGSAQPDGGGINSTLSADTISTGSPLAPNQSVNIQWVLGVKQGGTFRFYVTIEALP
jgi:hypothetical protein